MSGPGLMNGAALTGMLCRGDAPARNGDRIDFTGDSLAAGDGPAVFGAEAASEAVAVAPPIGTSTAAAKDHTSRTANAEPTRRRRDSDISVRLLDTEPVQSLTTRSRRFRPILRATVTGEGERARKKVTAPAHPHASIPEFLCWTSAKSAALRKMYY